MSASSCAWTDPDGRACPRPSFIYDPRRGAMLCREHALEPLLRAFGARADLEEKAEFVLRFLSLPSDDRREVLEALSAADRRELIEHAALFQESAD